MTNKNCYPEPNQNLDFAKMEEDILKFWQENKVFEKSVQIREKSPNASQGKAEFVFYDGPPFANGLPHYGHLLTGFIKDIFARYQTMKGKKVERKFGWDTHGLPVEMETEKELSKLENKPISGQIAIQEYGIEKFNKACEKSVMKYAGDWKNYVNRQGRFVDFDNSYKTMDINYMESVIWAFKELFNKGLLYEDFRVVPYSWACQTPLSNFETRMDNSYRRKESKALTVKFDLDEKSQEKILKLANLQGNISLVAWTTTPWTLPSNLALGVGKDIEYSLVAKEDDKNQIFIVAKGLTEKLGKVEILGEIKGENLVGLKYKPLFPYLLEKTKDSENSFTILHGDFVSTEEGTGIVHMAPGFGEDDQLLCKSYKIPTLCPVDEAGKFTNEIFDIKIAPSPLRGEGWGEGDALDLTNLSKNLRKNKTEAEARLWNILRAKRFDNYKFRRQHQIGNYIVDFVCLDKKLIIELDGGHHNEEENIKKDKERSLFLEKEGFYILRFWNNEIFNNIDGACENIWNFLNDKNFHPLPNPLPSRERELGRNPLSLNGSDQDVEIILSLKGRQVFETNDDIIKYLKSTGAWLKTEQYLHNYPHCWRTDTPLIYKAVSSWYVKVTDFKDRMIEVNKEINWIPNHIQAGQFGKWLEGARDWSITRNRFWGCPVPVWKSNDPQYPRIDVYGSLDDIERDFGVRPENLHRPFIDDLTRPNPDDPTGKSKMVRVYDVLDCWFESGSMPYAQAHYPFKNKEWFEDNFPADFITEYIAQTRGWFYTMVVLSTALFDKPPFKNVICHGTILDEKSQKLSKRLKNYADPLEIFASSGSDAMRFYMVSQPVMKGQELRIDKEGKAIYDTLRLSIKPLINAFNFFCLYANADKIKASRIIEKRDFKNNLDSYILTKLKLSVEKIDQGMKNYDTVIAAEEFNHFFESLNNWYIRRSRTRFWKSGHDQDKQDAYDVLYTCLLTMCEAAAPLLPFTSEFVWKALQD